MEVSAQLQFMAILPPERNPLPLNRKLSWFPGPVWTFCRRRKKDFFLQGFESQPEA